MTEEIQDPLIIDDSQNAFVLTKPEEPEVVVAPDVSGRSFLLRGFCNSTTRTGQMLVLSHRMMHDAALDVLDVHFPTPRPGLAFTKTRHRVYLGERKIADEYWPLIIEMRVTQNQDGTVHRDCRLLYPSGKALRKWMPLDLRIMKLRTTEEQRALISAFTGIIYKIRSEPEVKQTHHPKWEAPPRSNPDRRGPRPLGGIFERAGVKVGEVKHKLKHDNATIRGDLQRRLPTEKSVGALQSSGDSLDAETTAEMAAQVELAAATTAPAATAAGAVGLPGQAAGPDSDGRIEGEPNVESEGAIEEGGHTEPTDVLSGAEVGEADSSGRVA